MEGFEQNRRSMWSSHSYTVLVLVNLAQITITGKLRALFHEKLTSFWKQRLERRSESIENPWLTIFFAASTSNSLEVHLIGTRNFT